MYDFLKDLITSSIVNDLSLVPAQSYSLLCWKIRYHKLSKCEHAQKTLPKIYDFLQNFLWQASKRNIKVAFIKSFATSQEGVEKLGPSIFCYSWTESDEVKSRYNQNIQNPLLGVWQNFNLSNFDCLSSKQVFWKSCCQLTPKSVKIWWSNVSTKMLIWW